MKAYLYSSILIQMKQSKYNQNITKTSKNPKTLKDGISTGTEQKGGGRGISTKGATNLLILHS